MISLTDLANGDEVLQNNEQSVTRLKVGLLGIGLAAYWPQFAGLRDRLDGYVQRVADHLSCSDVDLTMIGLVDSSTVAVMAGRRLRAADVDIVFVYVATYALSAAVLPALRRLKVPVILLNLQPTSKIDYESFNRLPSRHAMTAEWLAYCSACPIPELVNVLHRSGHEVHQVVGTLEEDAASWKEIDEWIGASKGVATLANNRLGLLGHYYSGMMDIYTDLTRLSAVFGGHIDLLEVEELAKLRASVPAGSIDSRVHTFEQAFEMQPDCDDADIYDAAQTSVALDHLVARHDLGALAYYHEGTGSLENSLTISSIILGTSLLTASGIPVAGEYEVKNVLAMKLMASLGAGGSFTEFYATDFDDDVVLMGHDGPGHPSIAEGKPKVRSLTSYHGKVGRGLSIEMSVRQGPVTLLSITEDPSKGFKFVVAEGESVSGPVLEIGNTNSRYRFSIGARQFLSDWSAAGPAHHCSVGVGHIASTLIKVASLLKIPCELVC